MSTRDLHPAVAGMPGRNAVNGRPSRLRVRKSVRAGTGPCLGRAQVIDCLVADADAGANADADALLEWEAEQVARGGRIVPAALVVPEGDLGAWKAYCWEAAQRGIMRAAFTEFGAAGQWAKAQASLWAAQAEWESRKAAQRREFQTVAGVVL